MTNISNPAKVSIFFRFLKSELESVRGLPAQRLATYSDRSNNELLLMSNDLIQYSSTVRLLTHYVKENWFDL